MYAVIKTGGKQQRVKAGDVIEVEFMKVDPGSSVEFEPLLVVDDQGKAHVGKSLAKAKVVAKLVGDKKADKIKVFRYQPKSGYQRTQGHRQLKTVLEVQEVALSPGKVERKTEEEKPAAKKPAAKKPAAKKPAAKKPTAKKPAAEAEAKAAPEPTDEAAGDRDDAGEAVPEES
ncbi:MAG: 50S ribosomal protein L21 [Actinomycetota bacterium]